MIKGYRLIDAQATMEKAFRTPQGYLKAPALVTRTGVFTYRLRDGSILRQLRLASEVFKPESMATLAGIPITDDHPACMLIDSKNTSSLMKGFTSDLVEQAGEYLKTSLTFTEDALIKKVEGGQAELSCGYVCDLDETPGVTADGEAYDVIQRNIVYNHLASVEKGRAGPNVKVMLDSADAVMVADGLNEPWEVKRAMEKVTIGGKEFEVTAEAKSAILDALQSADADKKRLVAQVDDATGKVKEVQATADRETARADGAQAELDKAKAKLDAEPESDEAFRARFNARKTVLDVAERTLDEATVAKLDGMSEAEIKRAVIAAERPGVTLDGKSDDYVDASFDLIAEGIKAGSDQTKGLGDELSRARNDRADDKGSADEARKRASQRAKDAWKKKEA